MIFVTGGTGLLGNCVVRELCERGTKVRALCRAGTSREPFDGLPIDVVEGDLSDLELLASAIDGCSAVIHSAAMIHIGWNKLDQSREVNVAGTERVAEACLRNRCRFVHISTVDTLPAAESIEHPIDEQTLSGIPKTACSYVVSKTEAEQAVRRMIATTDLDGVIIHPGFMLGPYDWKPSSGRMMQEVNKAPIVAAPRGGCSLCDARDVASGIISAVDHGVRGQNYILAGENLTYQQMWRKILEVTGRKRHVFRLGPMIGLVGKMIDAANRMLPISEGDVNGAAIAMGGLNHFYDSTFAMQNIGYQRRPTEETLVDAWHWLVKRSR